jgi:hypothetical protein
MIICDFFPLYDFPSNVCAPSANLDRLKDDVSQSSTNDESDTNKIAPYGYGLQKRNRPSITEYILVIWVFTLFCEETRQVI